ncbi:MAG: nicotinamide riboside transporter PnuC [Kineosporiaceae bacterium]
MNILKWLSEASIQIGDYQLRWLELIGVMIGLASAVGGMKRRVWAWPVGITANVLLFFVYINAILDPQAGERTPLFGQSGRQIFFILTSAYGWYRWRQHQRSHAAGQPAITPRWATMTERAALVGTWLVGVGIVQALFAQIGAGWPAPRWYYWCDAWIFMGSLLATYAMARGWNEFWLCWIGVDLVGVPLLLHSNYIPTAVLYAFYAVFVIYGFVVWLRASRTETEPVLLDRDVSPAAAS